jgi:RNA polymerase sigma factor (sigma-70 family)
MAIYLFAPQLGGSAREAIVGPWRKAEGDFVNAGEVVLELRTDHVNLEISAAQSGRLARIERKEGENVKTGEVLALIEQAPAEDKAHARPTFPAKSKATESSPVPEPQIDALIRSLRSREPREAWTDFLDVYTPVMLQVIRHFEREEDAVEDCYLFVCEHLCQNGFRRLLHFRPQGPAKFSTWLCVVVRNLCLDWHRREFGRERVFESVARMPVFDREVFQALFVDCLSAEEACFKLKSRFPETTLDQLTDSSERIRRTLTARQKWLLSVRRTRTTPAFTGTSGQDDALLQVPSETPSPESWVALQEQHAALACGLSRLPASDRLLIRLRFERDLTLEEIARLLQMDNPQSADRRIREAIEGLRRGMK